MIIEKVDNFVNKRRNVRVKHVYYKKEMQCMNHYFAYIYHVTCACEYGILYSVYIH